MVESCVLSHIIIPPDLNFLKERTRSSITA